jgi:hypothetical protein
MLAYESLTIFVEFLEAMIDSRKLTIVTMLGVIAFISKGWLPTPIDKMFVVVQALTFALASLIISGCGATYASAVNGALLSLMRTGFFPFSFIFSVIYGLLIDSSFHIFKVKIGDYVKTVKLTGSLTLSTAITSLASMYVTTLVGLMPMMPSLYLAITVIGVLNGVVAGCLTSLIWNRRLHHIKG